MSFDKFLWIAGAIGAVLGLLMLYNRTQQWGSIEKALKNYPDGPPT